MHLDTRLDGQWSELSQQQISDGRIQSCPKQTLTKLVVGALDLLSLAEIFRVETPSLFGLMIAHRHPLATASADDYPLQ